MTSILAAPKDIVYTLDYTPRPQFIPFHQRTKSRACLVCHRRAGKTYACIYDLVDAALRSTKTRPRFAYVAPFLGQAKAVAWDYLCSAVRPLHALGFTINQAELRLDLFNGAQIRLFGADNPNALRGLGFDGIIIDEYADMDPRIEPVINPTLIDRNGWAVYIGTPRGHNEFYTKYKISIGEDPEGKDDGSGWYSLMLKASDSGILSEEALEQEWRRLSDNDYRQEYECDFEAAVRGAYYGPHMAALEEAGQICAVPYDKAAQVYTAWDLGYADATAVWFFQLVGKEIHLIDYYESEQREIADDVYAVTERPYRYAGHILPHDAYATSKQTGRTTAAIMQGLGLSGVRQAPDHRREDGISNCQVLLNRCWFDKRKTERGVEALKLYRAAWDEKHKTFKKEPQHDWASHGADAFRYLAMAVVGGLLGGSFYKPIKYPKEGNPP